ncbi:MAG: hypothetical protein ACU833_09495 [Gammaproteobacteria bacterium]
MSDVFPNPFFFVLGNPGGARSPAAILAAKKNEIPAGGDFVDIFQIQQIVGEFGENEGGEAHRVISTPLEN